MAEQPGGAKAERVYVAPDAAESFVRRLVAAHGAPDDDAAIVARCLVQADLRGIDTHGLVRLPGYLERVRRGLVNPHPSLRPKRVTPVAASLDGENGFGFVIGTRAMAEATQMAHEFGVGIVAVRRSTHFGMAASYVLQAVEAGFAALVFSNASPAMPPWGGRTPLIGTSPFAAGVPGGNSPPFVLDMSPAVAARGKIRKAARRGERIPLGWALDAEGRPTDDPAAALQGVVLPMGEHKGSGLSLLMDVFGGVLSGAAFAGGVRDQYKDFSAPQNVGHFFLAMKPDLFVPVEEVARRMDVLAVRVKSCPPAEGVTEILMPGEIEARQAEARRRTGIPYSAGEIAALQAEAERAKVAPLPLSPGPLDR
jgi:LDH2 family malate/lactate/ureidoglycolate dehydrogenase